MAEDKVINQEVLTQDPSPTGEVSPVADPVVIGEQPVFDFSLLSWGEARIGSRLQKQLSVAQASEDVDAIDAAFDAFQGYLSKVLISVPRSWLVKTAPEQIDWSDGSSINFLQGKKFQTLVEAWTEAQSFEAASGG